MLEITIGVVIVSVLLFDIFQTVLVPRFTPASLRLAPLFVGRFAWTIYRKLATFIHSEIVLDYFLGSFAPLAFVMIFFSWLVAMTVAFGFIIQGLGNEFHPHIPDIGTAIYVAGTSLLTIGFGDIVAVSPLGRLILLSSAATGVTLIALGVSFLFSMQQSVYNREVVVNTFQSRITPHSSAVHLLLNYAEMGLTDQFATQIQDWENWISGIWSSHRAFPLLCYFRSGHLCVSWITVLGIMLDASNLLSTTVNDRRFAHSEFVLQIGSKLVNSFRDYFKLDPANSCISREEFQAAYDALRIAGYQLHQEELAWERFHVTRSQYAPSLNAIAFNFVSKTPEWLQTPFSSTRTSSRTQEFIKTFRRT